MTAPAARVIRPLREFLRTESAGGVVLLVATAIALVWANSPWQSSYTEFWSRDLTLGVGSHSISLDLQHWVNDGLMTLFFFVVGLEIKRELVTGELRDPRAAALPVVAAVGGMVVPAALYLSLNLSGGGRDGWGIPMATDIAMAVGVLALFSRRVPPALKLFVLALAIVDDIGAILVIALFYSDGIEPIWLLEGAVAFAAMIGLRALGVSRIAPYVVVGVVFWLTIHESGVHATIAGVVVGLLTPTGRVGRRSEPVIEYLERVLHPWTSLVIVPLFALANAGVVISVTAVSDAVTSSVTQGVVLGLVVGKFVGILSFAWLGQRTRLGVLPKDTTWRGMCAVAAIAGVGFTVSLFIASLAFEARALNDAKMGILAGSLLAAAIGTLLILRLPVRATADEGNDA
jgi:NhaA family Na+:H+ antiporter